MSRTIKCIMLGEEAEGLDYAPYPGELGQRIYDNVSKEAWQRWLGHQTMLILSLIHISEPTRLDLASRMPSSA